MIKVRIPATSANMGSGFDSIGMAFKLYNNIYAERIEKGVQILVKGNYRGIPLDKTNLIYRSMLRFYDETGFKKESGIKIVQEDEIPMARGLGSSAACVVGGITIANEFSGNRVSTDDIIDIAAKVEGHPDNSTAAILGGIVILATCEKKVEYIKIDVSKLLEDNICFSLMIPDFKFETKRARGILPKSVLMEDAVFNCQRSALLVASLLTHDFNKLSVATEDRLHQPYRMEMIPNAKEIFKKSKEFGAKGVFLSGSGPIIVAINDKVDFNENMKNFLSDLPFNWKILSFEPDNEGVKVFEK